MARWTCEGLSECVWMSTEPLIYFIENSLLLSVCLSVCPCESVSAVCGGLVAVRIAVAVLLCG